MYALFIYSLKAAVCLAVFYLFFKLLLSRETFHRFNRFVVLAGMLLAFVLPLCVVTVYRELPVLPAAAVPLDGAPGIVVPEEAAFDWRSLLGVLFVVGAAVMLLHTLRSVVGVARAVRSGRRERLDDGTVLVRMPAGSVAPFSWWRYVVVSEDDMSANGREILCHERAHLRLRHSADLLIADLAGCLQWFNPAMWLLRRELRAIHEYEADRAVIASGADAHDYQLLLIRKAVGGRWYSVANSFNHSKLKNRITMMLRKKSSRWAGAKALFVLPLTAMALGAFAETVYVVPDDKVNKESVTAVVSGAENSEKEGPLYLVDGREVASMDEVAMDRIASVDVYKAGSAEAEAYGEKGRNGLIVVTLKKQGADRTDAADVHSDEIVVVGYGDAPRETSQAVPLYVVDGKETASIDDIDAAQIANIEIHKDAETLAAYGEKGRNGVVLITLRKPGEQAAAASQSARTFGTTFRISGKGGARATGKPLYLVDGVQVDDIDHLSAQAIESITVEKGSLPEIYKEQGYDGMIVVTTKQGADAQAFFRSDEWKEAQRKLNESGAYFQSDEWKEVQKKMAEQNAYFESDEWKAAQKQIEEAGKSAAEAGKIAAAAGARLEAGHLSVTSGNSRREQVGTVKIQNSGEAAQTVSIHADRYAGQEESCVTRSTGRITVTGTNGIPDDCLIFIDGKRAAKDDITKIAAGKIRRMDIYKGQKAVDKFGPEAAHGAIDIRTRKR